MNKYSIKDLERLTGIKAHTLRIWEQRYGILNPQRTDTNIRYYLDEDLRKILNVSLLNSNGYKISKIADLNLTQMNAAVSEITQLADSAESQIESIVFCMMTFDEARFEKVLSGNVLRYGFEKTMIDIIFPFMQRVGNMWLTGTIGPAHEHFISNMVRQKLVVAIDGQLPSPKPDAPKYLLFCPDQEYHELGLLFMNYMLRSRNCQTVYVGSSVPIADLEVVYQTHHPQYLFTYITTNPAGDNLVEYFTTLVHMFPKAKVLAAGNPVKLVKAELPEEMLFLNDATDAIAQIDAAITGH